MFSKYYLLLFLCYYTKCEENINDDNAAEIIWKLSKYAIESRQNYKKYKQEYYQNYEKNTIMDILYSVVQNDDLECVPKILCEVTSGTMSSGRQQGLNLPINFNMESVVGLLTVLNGARTSPVLHFGKAALLGISSKGNTNSCNTAYPKCPADPDKLVYYLNNHNGGFFRYFNGNSLKKKRINRFPKKYQMQHRPTYQNYLSADEIAAYYPEYYDKKVKVEKRIQNNGYSDNNYNYYQDNIFKFPLNNDYGTQNNHRKQKGFSFNNDDYYNTNKDVFSFSQDYDKNNFENDDKLFFPMPLNGHVANEIIFPTRTGTGQLILDDDELKNDNNNNNNEHFVFQNNYNDYNNFYTRRGKGLVFPSY